MDFHSLSRRELQSLCKRNSIPANTTNLAMADALASLRIVEGLGEEDRQRSFLSPKKAEAGPPEPPKTGRRTSPRLPPQGSPLPRSRRVAATSPRGVPGDEEEGAPPEKTPRAPVTARKGAAAATRTSTRVSKKEEEEKTVGVTTRRRATRQSSTCAAADVVAYGSISTRRSTRGRAAAAATKMADLTSKEEEEENDVAENVTTSNDQAIGEEKDLLSIEESKEGQKGSEIVVSSNQENVSEQEQEEKDVAENVIASNDQAIGEEKGLLSTEESKEDQKITGSENIVPSNQENVTEQEHQEEENVTASNNQGLEEEKGLLSTEESKEDQKVTGSEIVSSNQEEVIEQEHQEEKDVAENITTNDQAIGEEKDLLSTEESKEDQDNVTEQEHQEEKGILGIIGVTEKFTEGLEADGAIEQAPNEEENVQVEEEPIVEMTKNDQNEDTEEEGQVTMSALEDSPVSGLISCEDPKEEGREESGADELLLLGLQRISISVEPKEGDTIDPIAPASSAISSELLVQEESLGSCNDDRSNKENADRVTITSRKAELESTSLRKLKAMYKDIKMKEGEEKRSALKALDENCL